MAFLPADFEVPTLLETDRFRLRPISVDDLDMDHEVEQDRKDLRWHEEEFERRSSFDDAVMAPDESRLLGCVYADPATEAGSDAEVHLWVRSSEAGTGLEEQLEQTVRHWVADAGPSGGSPTRAGSPSRTWPAPPPWPGWPPRPPWWCGG
jgi:hypothetical protein